MEIQFTKRRLNHNLTAGRQKIERNKIIIYLRYVAQIALHPFYKNKQIDIADNIERELIRTLITEIFCLTAKQEAQFNCPKIRNLQINHPRFSPLDLLCPPLTYTHKALKLLKGAR